MKRQNNFKNIFSIITSIFVIGSLSFGLTSCDSDDNVVIDYSAYNDLIKIRNTLNEELKDHQIHMYNQNDERYWFNILYDGKDYFMDFEMYLTNSHGTQYLSDHFKLAYPALSDMNGDLIVYLNTFRLPEENGFQNSIHALIYKANEDSNAYWDIKSDEVVNGIYTFDD